MSFFIKNPSNNQRKTYFFSFELREKVLENNQNTEKIQGKSKMQSCCEPCSSLSLNLEGASSEVRNFRVSKSSYVK